MSREVTSSDPSLLRSSPALARSLTALRLVRAIDCDFALGRTTRSRVPERCAERPAANRPLSLATTCLLHPPARTQPDPRRGNTIITPTAEKEAAAYAKSVGYDWTYQEMAEHLAEKDIIVSRMTVWRHVRDTWIFAKQRHKPSLTAQHMKDRAAFCKANLGNQWYGEMSAWLDLDEKWFFCVKTAKHLKVPPGETPPDLICANKDHLPKVMMLACLGRPRFDAEGNLMNGKICCIRVAEKAIAQRKSRNRARGAEFWKDVSMTGDRYLDIMTRPGDGVFASAVKAYEGTGVTHITIQQDGAKAHTGKKKTGFERITALLNEAGAKLTPQIRVITQPAKSPDLNICDLSFFRALSCQTDKARRLRDGASLVPLWEKDKLADDVVKAFKDYPVEQLDKMWRYKACVVDRVANHGGLNGSHSHHHRTHEEKAKYGEAFRLTF